MNETAQVGLTDLEKLRIKQLWRRAQDSILLVLCGQGFNKEYRGHYNRYKVLIGGKPIQDVFNAEELKNLSYWVQRSGVMAMTIWGSSQRFDAQISLARFLKLTDERDRR